MKILNVHSILNMNVVRENGISFKMLDQEILQYKTLCEILYKILFTEKENCVGLLIMINIKVNVVECYNEGEVVSDMKLNL